MKNKTRRYIIVATILVAIIILYNLLDFKKVYMVVFHRTGVVVNLDTYGKIEEIDGYVKGKIIRKEKFKSGVLDGWKFAYYTNGNAQAKSFYKSGKLEGIEFNYYKDGKIKRKESFKQGKREGPDITYYENGQIEQSLFQKNDKAEGIEHAYYKDGKLQYTRKWVNNHPYGDMYYYDDNAGKKVLFYHAYDVLGDKFYLNRYDESRTDGYAFSRHVYSKDKDSVIVLGDNNTYRSISDLYVTIANPDSASTQIQMLINNKRYRDFDLIDNNTIEARNVFLKKGIYDIVINGRFVDKPDDITTLKMKVIKE